jgi:hypothetical protein
MKKKPARPPVAKTSTKTRGAISNVTAMPVETPFPCLEIRITGPVNEHSVGEVLEAVAEKVHHHQLGKVLVDLRQGAVDLTLSDKHGLAKMVATRFAGVVERVALVVRPADLLPEKFFEPTVRSRGLPMLVTDDIDEATYWLGAKFLPPR